MKTSTILLMAAIMAGGMNVADATTSKTTVTKTATAAASATLSASDFVVLSGGRATNLKKDAAMSSALTKKGFKLTSSKFYPGDPDADLVADQDDVTVKTYSKGGIKVTLNTSDNIVWHLTIQFPSSSQANAFASKLKSVGITGYDGNLYMTVQGSKVTLALNVG